MKFYDQMKEQARDTVKSTWQILLNSIGNVTSAAASPPTTAGSRVAKCSMNS